MMINIKLSLQEGYTATIECDIGAYHQLGIDILVVDDDHDLLLLIERFLGQKNHDFKITSTNSGQDALRLLEKVSYDAIICDFDLGQERLNGIDLLKWMRGSGNYTPFIMFTGRSKEEVAIEALNLGADFYLKKDQADAENLFHELAIHIRNTVQKKKMKDALKESEEQFRAVFHEAPIGVARVALDGTLLLVNKKLADMVDYSEEELVGMKVINITHPHDRPREVQLYQNLINGESDTLEMEKRYIRSDEKVVWGRLRASLVRNSEGKPSYLIGMVEDISVEKNTAERLQESEKQFRTLFEKANVGMTIVSIDDKLLDYNQAMCDMLGYTREEMQHMQVHDFSHPEDMEIDMRLAANAYSRNQDFYQMFKRYIRKDGSTLRARFSWILIRDRHGKPKLVMGMVEEIDSPSEFAHSVRVQQE